MDALEVFGFTGEYHTKFYAPIVRSLEVWEINPNLEDSLKKNLPNSRIKITDAFNEIKYTLEKFDLIVIDNPVTTFGKYCEHFDLFPDIFRITKKKAVIILNVLFEMPQVEEKYRPDPNIFNEHHLKYRSSFYNTANPDHILPDEIVNTYKKLCFENGYVMDWFFFQRRTSVFYFIFSISKM